MLEKTKNEFPKKESYYKYWIQQLFGGEVELHVPGVGYIDNVTPNFILEVKHVDRFREAIGQVLHYWVVLKDRAEILGREPCIFLFSHLGPIPKSKQSEIRKVCAHARIRNVLFYPGLPQELEEITEESPDPFNDESLYF